MDNENKSTAPKPFVFVLMPFKDEFDDIYKFGIKGAAELAGAYAERVDEQKFTEAIIERIFNQINKADVIVADMTGCNEKVFYEVGYAHALGKIVLLLAQNKDDISFDLNQKQHIIYKGKIDTLKTQLTDKLNWAINESSRKRKQNLLEKLSVSLPKFEIPEANSSNNAPIIDICDYSKYFKEYPIHTPARTGSKLTLTFSVRNLSLEPINITLVYLFTSGILAAEKLDDDWDFHNPIGIDIFDPTDGLSKQFKISHSLPLLPYEAVDQFQVEIGYFRENGIIDKLYKLRTYTSSGNFHDFPFRIRAEI